MAIVNIKDNNDIDTNLPKNRKRRDTYSRFENCLAELLWTLVFYLTLFNMLMSGTESALFLHMRLVTGPYAIAYWLTGFFLIILTNLVLKTERNLFVQISCGLLPTGISLSVFYFSDYPFSKVVMGMAIALFLVFILHIIVFHYRYVKGEAKEEKDEGRRLERAKFWNFVLYSASRLVISLGVVSLLFCVVLFFIQKRSYSFIFGYKTNEVIRTIENDYVGFENYLFSEKRVELRKYAGADNLLKLADDVDDSMDEIEEVFQYLVDIEMEYLGCEKVPEVRISKELIGDARSTFEDGTILINEKNVRTYFERLKKGEYSEGYFKTSFFLISQEVLKQGLVEYYTECVSYMEKKNFNDTNLHFARLFRGWEVELQEDYRGIDSPLIWEDYEEYSTDLPREADDWATKMAERIDYVANYED